MKYQYMLNEPFTRNQYDWIKDILSSLMLWFQYEENASRKLKIKIQKALEEVERVGYRTDRDDQEG